MDLARYVVEAVIREGRSYREVASAHGVSKSWVAKMVGRYRGGGYEALQPRSRAPHRIPHRTSSDIEDRIVLIRKQLTDQGLDAGAATIHYHLSQESDETPSVATIWRVLKRRGFVTPQPHKRPKSSWIRFEAQLPNQCWQADVTHWRLADDTEVEICNILDDYSRVVTASRVFAVTTARAVVEVFDKATTKWGLPASVLTDNGCVFTAWHRGGATSFEMELLSLGIEMKHSRPYHPQTCGKIERFHQTLKKYLVKQTPAHSITELQAQIDWFIDYYNNKRPHRSKNRTTPLTAYNSRDKARPDQQVSVEGVRVRQDRVDKSGTVTLRHNGNLHHIGVGRDHHHKRVIMLIAGVDIRIITPTGEPLRQLTLDPTKDYQGTGRPPGPPKGRKTGRTKPGPSTMP
jgi:transposase InsO family protein